jgi:hypothetical protein
VAVPSAVEKVAEIWPSEPPTRSTETVAVPPGTFSATLKDAEVKRISPAAPPTTVAHAENSDVLPLASVAVAVTNWPRASVAGLKVNDASPFASVASVTSEPR